MRRPSSLLVPALLCGLGFVVPWSLSAQASGPCETDDAYRALDFLLGEWRLVSEGEAVGRSRVEKLEGGCLVAETWSFADGMSGRTYSSFDPVAGEWRRFSVSNSGAIVRSDGTVDGDEIVIDGLYVSADGERSYWHERLIRIADGRIVRIAGISRRVGRGERPSTVLFEGYYDPVGPPVTESSRSVAPPEAETAEIELPSAADEPAKPSAVPEPVTVAAEPEPALAAAEPPAAAPGAGEVTPDSARATDAEMIERIAMASPMVLRLPLGRVEGLPRGYAWITRDTAPYLCEGVTIERLEVARRERRGQVELEVELAVHGRQGSRAVDVSVGLRRAGQLSAEGVVASGAASGRVGRSIPEQIQHDSVAVVVRMSMAAEVFDAVVAEPERPDLVITLAVGK